MFRPNRLFAPLVALALLGLSACAEAPARRAATVTTPTATQSQTVTAPRSTPAPDDQSLRLDGGDVTAGGSCRQQCERGHNVCMDSVAARTQSGLERPDSSNPFSPSDNCGYQLRQCFDRCGAAR